MTDDHHGDSPDAPVSASPDQGGSRDNDKARDPTGHSLEDKVAVVGIPLAVILAVFGVIATSLFGKLNDGFQHVVGACALGFGLLGAAVGCFRPFVKGFPPSISSLIGVAAAAALVAVVGIPIALLLQGGSGGSSSDGIGTSTGYPTGLPSTPPPTPCVPVVTDIGCSLAKLGYKEITPPGPFVSALRMPQVDTCGTTLSSTDLAFHEYVRVSSTANGAVAIQVTDFSLPSSASSWLARLQASVTGSCSPPSPPAAFVKIRELPTGASKPSNCAASAYPNLGDQTLRLTAQLAPYIGDEVMFQLGRYIAAIDNSFDVHLKYPLDLDYRTLESLACLTLEYMPGVTL